MFSVVFTCSWDMCICMSVMLSVRSCNRRLLFLVPFKGQIRELSASSVWLHSSIPCYSTLKSSIMPQELMVRDVKKAVLIVQLQPCNFSFTWKKLVLYSASYYFGCFLEKNIVVWLLSCASLKCCRCVSTAIILVCTQVLHFVVSNLEARVEWLKC